MDPDPGNFFEIYCIFLTKNYLFSNFLFFSLLICILKLDEPFRNGEIFIISFFKNSDLGFKSKKFFFSFWLIFYPLEPDPGSQNLPDP